MPALRRTLATLGSTDVDQRIQFMADLAASSVASQLDTNDPDVRENMAKAKRQHRKRFRTQATFWGTVLLTSSSMFPLMSYLTRTRPTCGANPTVLSCSVLPETAALAVVAFVAILAWLYHHFWYLRERKHDWTTAMSDAQAMINAEKTADGNTGIFRIYVQTKRRSYWLITLSFGCAVAAAAYVLALIQNGQSIASLKDSSGLLLVLLIGCGCIGLLRAAYLIGSSFAPGAVIVRHVIALAFLAVSNITDIGEARRQVDARTNDFVKRAPWWFFTG